MKFSSRWSVAALVLLASLVAASAATARPAAHRASIQACVLLPDTKSSARYELFDRPYLLKAFKAAGVAATVVNAQGDAQKQRSQADDCTANGAKVVLLDALDPASGAAITNAVVSAGAKVIDYDRLVPKSKASYYVSFDNVKVGKLQGKGLATALKGQKGAVVAELNGGITDNNAKLFKQGYDSVLNPLYKNGTLKKAAAGDQWTDWDPVKGQSIFEQMLARNGNKINGVLAANDGLAGAVVATLKAKGLKPIPVTGQDATPTGVQYIIAGWQTGTVYKSVKKEAAAAAAAAIDLIKGKAVTTNGKVSGTPSILLTPVWITKHNYTLLFKDGFVKKSQVCVGSYAKYCK
ncbi:MAG TPA: substrate-binding domain-containing protein [Gaiellaceae bacterium]|nr:substrate-binding domain-containing protein [Gaiellaceae bacterium]